MKPSDDRTMFRMLWRLALAAPLPLLVGSAACGQTAKATTDGGFCADDRPPSMQNYPGCAPPYCVPFDSSSLDGGTLNASDASTIPTVDCQAMCGDAGTRSVISCSMFAAEGDEWVKCQPDCTGRRPVALVDPPIAHLDQLGGYFAEMARLEAASVVAFRHLACELVAHVAPRQLVVAARQAARDETGHARLARTLAARFGATYVAPQVAPAPLRDLSAIAMDNVIEGCARESWGALAALYQARHAADPEVRRAMRSIARDETRHATLSYAIASWADTGLDSADRARVAAARRAAVASLRAVGPTPRRADRSWMPGLATWTAVSTPRKTARPVWTRGWSTTCLAAPVPRQRHVAT